MRESIAVVADKAERAADRAMEAANRIETHEQVCAERYKGIRDDVGGVKSFLGRAAWAIIGGMAAIIGALLWVILKLP